MLDQQFEPVGETAGAVGQTETLLVGRAWWRQKSGRRISADLRKNVARRDGEWRSCAGDYRANAVSVEPVEVADITEVAEAIDAAANASGAPNTTLLLGAVTERGQAELDTKNVVRRDYRSQNATFYDAPTHVHYLDVDSLVLPDGYKLTDPIERLAWWLRSLLPADLADAAMYVQATASHGTVHPSGKLVPRLRAAFWTSEAITLAEWKKHVERRIIPHVAQRATVAPRDRGTPSALDVSIYTPGHYIFVQPPKSRGGGTPYPGRRSILLDGEKWEVELDALPSATDSTTPPREAALQRKDGAGRWRESLTDEELLAAIQTGHSHEPILALCARLGIRHGETTELEAAIREIEPLIVARLRATSQDEADFARRLREEVESGALYRSAAAMARKHREEVIREVEPEAAAMPQVVSEAENGKRLRAVISHAYRTGLDSGRPRVDIVRAPPGAGKTWALIDAITERDLYDHRILYLAPNHKLAGQTAEDIRASFNDPVSQARIRHLRGRRQPGVCINPELDAVARMLEDAGASPRDVVCGRCPFHDQCEYILRSQDDAPGIVIMTHADLISSLARISAASCRMPNLTVIDESPLQTLIAGGQRAGALDLLGSTHLPSEQPGFHMGTVADIAANRFAVRDVLAGCRQGSVGSIEATQLLDRARDAIQLERLLQARLRTEAEAEADGLLRRQISASEMLATGCIAKIARQRRASLLAEGAWKALEFHRNATVPRSYVKGLSRTAANEVRVNLAPEIPPVVSERPTILLDATADEDLSRRVFKSSAFASGEDSLAVYDIPSSPGCYRLVQVPDATFSATHLLRRGASRHASSDLTKLRRIIAERAAFHIGKGGEAEVDVLVVAQVDIEEALKPLPANVATAHFNDLRGLNDFENVPCLIVVGRPLPPISEIESQADALLAADPKADDLIRVEKHEYVAKRFPLRKSDGQHAVVEIRSPSHPEPLCASLLEQPLAEIVQAVGRARVTRRTEANPCEILVFGQHQAGLPVDQFMLWRQFSTPSMDDIARRLGVWPRNAEARRQMFPELREKTAETVTAAGRTLDPPSEAIEVAWTSGDGERDAKALVVTTSWEFRVRRFLGGDFSITDDAT